jgi:hypothetical protein
MKGIRPVSRAFHASKPRPSAFMKIRSAGAGAQRACLASAATSRPGMAPQRFEKIESAPGNRMALAGQARTHNMWYGGHRDRRPEEFPVASRRMAATSDIRAAHASATPPQAARKWRRKGLK